MEEAKNTVITAAAQDTGLNRNTTDKYYTKSTVVDICIELVKAHIEFTPDDLIIEPSAGGGAFIEKIKGLGAKFAFYDIIPEHKDIIKSDYLKLDIKPLQSPAKIHVIGNPPFGRQSSTAIKFIKKSCLYANSISFILPKSFKKESMKRHFTSNFHLVSETDLPPNSFSTNGFDYDVPCIFQIWVKRDEERKMKDVLTPIGYKFVGRAEQPDISFRRVGVNAGNISRESINKSVQSHYFIKFDRIFNDDINKKISEIKWDVENTVGPKSISKQELMDQFNKLFNE